MEEDVTALRGTQYVIINRPVAIVTGPMPKKKLPSVLAALFIGAYFIVLTKDAVLSYFSPDDCMNIYRSWANSAAALVKARWIRD